MKFSFTNKSAVAVPVHAEGEDWADVIAPGATAILDRPGSVWVIGAKPTTMENLRKGFTAVLKTVAAFVSQRDLSAPSGMVLEIGMTNEGTNPVRMIPGDVESEQELKPNTGTTAVAVDYVELRELTPNVNPVEEQAAKASP